MKINEDLIRQVMAHIRANSERWDQRSYVGDGRGGECGTTHCFAGWTMRLEGIGYADGWFRVPEGHRAFEFAARARWAETPVVGVSGGGVVRDEFEVARQLLGLDRVAAGQIFYFYETASCQECSAGAGIGADAQMNGSDTFGLGIFVRHVAHVTGLEGL